MLELDHHKNWKRAPSNDILDYFQVLGLADKVWASTWYPFCSILEEFPFALLVITEALKLHFQLEQRSHL